MNRHRLDTYCWSELIQFQRVNYRNLAGGRPADAVVREAPISEHRFGPGTCHDHRSVLQRSSTGWETSSSLELSSSKQTHTTYRRTRKYTFKVKALVTFFKIKWKL